MSALASETVGHFTYQRHRLEYSQFGAGNQVVVLIHGQLMSRRMHNPLARHLASRGLKVVTVDLLGHGRSDRPEDPREYSMSDFGLQTIALLDHLQVDRAVVGGTSLGANVSLEVADLAPERVAGLIVEMPVLDNAVEAGIAAFAPLIFVGRFAPGLVAATALLARTVPQKALPFWLGIGLDTLQQRPKAMAATVHGLFFGRVAPSTAKRRQLNAPALIIGHPFDPVHLAADAEMLADEMPRARLVRASSIAEWRLRPNRLNELAAEFALEVFTPTNITRVTR